MVGWRREGCARFDTPSANPGQQGWRGRNQSTTMRAEHDNAARKHERCSHALLAQSKICDGDVSCVSQKYVFWLEVAVDDAQRV